MGRSGRARIGASSFADRNRERYRQDDIVALLRARRLDRRRREDSREQGCRRGVPAAPRHRGGRRPYRLDAPAPVGAVRGGRLFPVVEVCRRQYPGLDVRECDARDLSVFTGATFALVVFSFNSSTSSITRKSTSAPRVPCVLRPTLGCSSTPPGTRTGRCTGVGPWPPERTTATELVEFLLHLPFSMKRYAQDLSELVAATATVRRPWFLGHLRRAYEFRLVVHWTLPSTERRRLGSIGSRWRRCWAATGLRSPAIRLRLRTSTCWLRMSLRRRR